MNNYEFKNIDWLLVRAFQKKEGITDKNLSAVLGVEPRTISNWRNEDNFIARHGDEFKAIAKIFKQQPAAFTKGTEENNKLWESLIEEQRRGAEKMKFVWHLRYARRDNAIYNGVIVSIQPESITQRWEDNGKVHALIEHRAENLIAGGELIELNNAVCIRYKDGKGTVTPLEKSAEKEIER